MHNSLAALNDGLRGERIRASRQFENGAFRNPSGAKPEIGNPLPLLGEYVFKGGDREPRVPLPVLDPRPGLSRAAETGLRVTWLGHSTVLLELDGVRVLADPVFGRRWASSDAASLSSTGGLLMPVHWGTFNLALHPWREPAETLYVRAAERGVRLFTPRLGEVLEAARRGFAAWWRALAGDAAAVAAEVVA
jgi:hypothetical protein